MEDKFMNIPNDDKQISPLFTLNLLVEKFELYNQEISAQICIAKKKEKVFIKLWVPV